MTLMDERGKVVDIWLKPASIYETRTLKDRLRFSSYLRVMVEGNRLMEDKAYKG